MVVGDLATQVDVAVLGAGPGGYVAAIRAAQLGLEVALIDPRPAGGACLHATCIPARALLSAIQEAAQARSLVTRGIDVGEIGVDWARLQTWKDGVVADLAAGVATLLERHGVSVVQGHGWFIDDDEIRVEGVHGSQRFQFERAVVATGAMAAERGSETDSQVLTPAQALALDRLPARVAVVGASGRAAELAELFCGAGSEVRWLIPAGVELLAPFDDVVLRMVTSALSEQGIEVVTDVADPAAAVDSEPCIVWFGTPRGCTGDLQLDRVQLQADASGFLAVDEQQRTANPRILAVGDVTGGAASAALATQQGRVAAEVCAGRPAASEPQAIPAVLWTTPQAAMVGLTQAAAAAAGYRTIQGRMPLSASGAGRLAAAAAGVTLVVAEADSEVVLGVTLVGPGAAERIGQAALALEMGATLTDLSATLQPHPTLSETLPEAAADALGAAIHLFHPNG